MFCGNQGSSGSAVLLIEAKRRDSFRETKGFSERSDTNMLQRATIKFLFASLNVK